MNDLLQEIRFIPGVIGSFAYLEKQGVIASDLAERYPEPVLHQAGRVMNRLFHVHGIACRGISSVDIAFDDVSLSARKVQDQAAFITLSDSTVNSEFVAMTVGSMLGEIQAAVEAASLAPPAAAPPQPAAPTAARAPAAAPAAVSREPSVQLSRQTVDQLQDCLARALGPVASLVLRDALNAWHKAGSGAIQDLLDRLAGEIDDPGFRQRFRTDADGLVVHLLAADRAGAPSPAAAATPRPVRVEELPTWVLELLGAPLAKAVGPISQLILGEALAAWKQGGPASRDRLPVLLDELCREIGDPNSIAEFRKEVERLMG